MALSLKFFPFLRPALGQQQRHLSLTVRSSKSAKAEVAASFQATGSSEYGHDDILYGPEHFQLKESLRKIIERDILKTPNQDNQQL